jgi:hypothetical protein
MSKNNIPVSVVISTKKIDDNYLKHVEKMFSHPKTEILIYENDGAESLPQIYNSGLESATNDIVVFMHDDLIIETTNVTQKLVNLFDRFPDYGIIGVAGTDNLKNGVWWEIQESMQGQVRHLHEGRIHRSNYSGTFGEGLKQVVIVDGLFFAVCKSRIRYNFDQEFPGFHFYDLPFCINNHLRGVKIGVTTKILVTHKSVGIVNDQWVKNRMFFEAKYGKHLPLRIQAF